MTRLLSCGHDFQVFCLHRESTMSVQNIDLYSEHYIMHSIAISFNFANKALIACILASKMLSVLSIECLPNPVKYVIWTFSPNICLFFRVLYLHFLSTENDLNGIRGGMRRARDKIPLFCHGKSGEGGKWVGVGGWG
jgi:hypothetical protein